MNDRDVMQQALEALEMCSSALAEELAAWDIDPPLHHVLQASNACEPAINSLLWKLEQPEQEPVAWMSQAGNFLSPLEFTVGEAALYGWTPVYTTPPAPQRKPLTDEQYNAIQTRLSRMDSGLWSRGGTSERKLLEAIWEAAHGIKETP